MAISDNMMAFKKALDEDQEVLKKFDEACARILKEKKAESDGELFAMAAKEIGFDIPASEFEVTAAEAEPLDEEELAIASGGENCVFNEGMRVGSLWEDENGHNPWCIATWHCYTAMMHTEGGGMHTTCYSDFQCVFSEHYGDERGYRSHCIIDNVKEQ